MLVVARASKPRSARMRAEPTSQGLGMMNAPGRAWSARKTSAFCAWVGTGCSLRAKRWGNAEGRVYDFGEVSLFAQDKAFGLRRCKIFAGFLVGFETRLIAFVGSETVESDEPPRNVVCAFVRKEISDQMTAAAGNDATPVLGVLLESAPLERIDLVANDTDNGHRGSPKAGAAGSTPAGKAMVVAAEESAPASRALPPPLRDDPGCATSTLRLSSNGECRSRRHGSILDRRGDRGAGAHAYALLSGGRTCAHQHGTRDSGGSEPFDRQRALTAPSDQPIGQSIGSREASLLQLGRAERGGHLGSTECPRGRNTRHICAKHARTFARRADLLRSHRWQPGSCPS